VPEGQAGEERRADAAGLDLGAQLAEWFLPAKILVHNQWPAGAVGRLDHGEAVLPRGSERFLADGQGAVGEGELDQGAVGVDGGRYIYEIRPNFGEHGGGVGVDVGDVEIGGEGAGLVGIDVTNGNNFS